MNRTDKWNASFDAVRTYINTHGKYPSTTSKNIAEKSLAQWWSRQKYLLKQQKQNNTNQLSPQQLESVEGLVQQNENLERSGLWDDYYNQIVNKYKQDGKVFSHTSESANEAKLARWWNQQKTFARKFAATQIQTQNGMNQERYDKVVALLRVMGKELVKQDTVTNK